MREPIIRKLRKFMSVFEAEHAKILLKDAGIDAYLEGTEAQISLSYVGSALGGVRLLVAEKDLAAAEKVLSESKSRSSEIEPWTCGQCFSEVDGGFELCWNCGQDYAHRWTGEEESK